MKPIFGIRGFLTLLFQGIVCANIGMEYCETGNDMMVGRVMTVVLATKGSGFGLVIGIAFYLSLNGFNRENKKSKEQTYKNTPLETQRGVFISFNIVDLHFHLLN